MKTKMKKFGKMSSVFELSIAKLGYMEFWCKSVNKKLWPIFGTFLTDRSKNEDEDEKIWENEFNF